ncbi:MAG TPA: DUF1990 domain-containing protein [Terracidiphilus sp.]|jgi:uncharacterized protein (UPF0548 family)|nr:DUF1990 domain-containing protein [Terracidiphilus sp.]
MRACDTGPVFSLRRPTQSVIDSTLSAGAALAPACPSLLTLRDGLSAQTLPRGFAHDMSHSEIGRGEADFLRARKAFAGWLEFDLGWTRVANPGAPVSPGALIAVEAHAAGIWTLNLSRTREAVDTDTAFGFLYETTRMHVEEGQERFAITFDQDSGEVQYEIEAVSRPRHWLARLGYPYVRGLQHKFVRDSHARMRAVLSGG